MRHKTRNLHASSGKDPTDGGRTSPREWLEPLVRNKERFLAFLGRRLGSRADAEDLLQSAYLKLVDQRDTLRDDERMVPWFFQVLRNSVADHYRRRGAAARAHERLAAETEAATGPDEDLYRAICSCVEGALAGLKREHAEVVRRVELDGMAVQEVARALGITPNNASVRLHRGRQALREALHATCGVCTEHGCLDCTCQKRSGERSL